MIRQHTLEFYLALSILWVSINLVSLNGDRLDETNSNPVSPLDLMLLLIFFGKYCTDPNTNVLSNLSRSPSTKRTRCLQHIPWSQTSQQVGGTWGSPKSHTENLRWNFLLIHQDRSMHFLTSVYHLLNNSRNTETVYF